MAHHDLSELRLIRLAGRIDQFGHFLEIAPSDPSRRQCCQRAGGDLAQVLVMMNASTRDKDGVADAHLVLATIDRVLRTLAQERDTSLP